MADRVACPWLIQRFIAGRPEDGIALVKKAMRLSPFYPAWYLSALGHGYRLTRRYDEALQVYRMDLERRPDSVLSRAALAIVYAELGREAEAHAQVTEILGLDPGYSVQRWAQGSLYRDRVLVDQGVEALRRSGLP